MQANILMGIFRKENKHNDLESTVHE